MKLLIAFLMAASPLTQAHAQSTPSAAMELLNQYDACTENCEAFEDKEILDWEKDTLTPELRAELQSVADDQSRVWVDTILEGEYIAGGETELTTVTAVYHQKILIGYKISYAQGAYYTGSCDYDSENEETLEECTQGSISETSIVTLDFKEYDITQDGYANFED